MLFKLHNVVACIVDQGEEEADVKYLLRRLINSAAINGLKLSIKELKGLSIYLSDVSTLLLGLLCTKDETELFDNI